MVETVLESFDFLNTDCSADELSLFGSVRTASIRYVSAALPYRGKEGRSWECFLIHCACLAQLNNNCAELLLVRTSRAETNCSEYSEIQNNPQCDGSA